MSYPIRICQPALERLFRQHPPSSILAIGDTSAEALDHWQNEQPHLRVTAVSCCDDLLARVQAAGQHEAAVVSGTLEHLERAEAEQLIALLRDQVAQRLFVLLPIGDDWPGQRSHWSLTDMTALGLRQVACFEHEGRALHLYRFDLYDYKLTPDWLNPRFWANPEMWDRARW